MGSTTFSYNGSSYAPTAEANGVGGDVIVLSNTAEVNAGSYESEASISTINGIAIGSYAYAGDYTLTNTTQEYTITKIARTNVTVNMDGYTYAGTISTPSVNGNVENGSVRYYYNTTGSNSSGTEWIEEHQIFIWWMDWDLS